MDITNFFNDFSEANPHVYFIYRIDGLHPVAWFPTEKLCLAAFEYYDSVLFEWVAVRYTLLFRFFAERELDYFVECEVDYDD